MYGITAKPIIDLKQEPDQNSQTSDQLLYGMVYEVLGSYGEFYKINSFYNYEGFLHRSLFFNAPQPTDLLEVIVTAPCADILEQPDIKTRIFLTVPRGSIINVALLEKTCSWLEVSLYTGETGYIRTGNTTLPPIYNEEIKKHDEAALRDAIVNSALGYLTAQYRWGGKTFLGIDCSGLAFMAYYLNGIIILRDSYIKEGFPVKNISQNRLKKGDLIFFKGHVAIYIGDDMYVHSSLDNNGVYINSFDKNHGNFKEGMKEKIIGYGSVF